MAYENIAKFIKKFLPDNYTELKALLLQAAEDLKDGKKEEAIQSCQKFIDKFTELSMQKLRGILTDEKTGLTPGPTDQQLFNALYGKENYMFYAMIPAAQEKGLDGDLYACYYAVKDLRKLQQAMAKPEPKYSFKATQFLHSMVAVTPASSIRAFVRTMDMYKPESVRDDIYRKKPPTPKA